MVKILEIDDNNNSNVFGNSEVIDCMSVKVDGSEDAFTDVLFEQMANGVKLVLDLGGGNDSRAGLKLIKDSGVAFTYIIPVGNSLSQLQNAVETYNLINEPENTVFALNQVNDMDKIKKDWIFWFGSEEFGIDSVSEKLNNPKIIFIPRSPLFELSALHGITISELATIGNGIPREKYLNILFKQSGGDKEIFKSLNSKYKQSVLAKEYLELVMESLKEAVGTTKNIAVVSTKGGVGKSTIAWHLAPLILKG